VNLLGDRSGGAVRHVLAPLRLLTPVGRGLVVTAVAAAVLGSRFHWLEFTQLAAVAAGLLVLGLVWQLLPGAPEAHLTLQRQRMVQGSPAPTLDLEVHAGSAPMLFPRLLVPVGRSTLQLRLGFLGPFSRTHLRGLRLPDLPRGVHDVGPVIYEKADPVGAISRRIRTGERIELLVAPQVTDLPAFAGGLANDLDGATSQQLSMSDLAFHALREYVPGDDLRHVHWRSSGKAGELLVRQFHETRRGHITILLDPARSSYPRARDFELAVSMATSIALRAVRDDLDTYFRCGPHLARSREPVAMTDIACRFTLEDADQHVAHVASAADATGATGLVVQVTGSARELAVLDDAASRFGSGAERIVLRADSAGQAQLVEHGALHEISVPDLPQLRRLLDLGMR